MLIFYYIITTACKTRNLVGQYPCRIYIDYFCMVGEWLRFLLTSCKGSLNEHCKRTSERSEQVS